MQFDPKFNSFPSSSLGTHTPEALLPDPVPIRVPTSGVEVRRTPKPSFEDRVPKLELGNEATRQLATACPKQRTELLHFQ